MQLIRRLLGPQRLVDHFEYQWMGDHRNARRAASQQRSGSARVVAGEVVSATRCLREPRFEFGADAVAQVRVGKALDDHYAVIAERPADIFRRDISGKTLDRRQAHLGDTRDAGASGRRSNPGGSHPPIAAFPQQS